MRLRRGAHLGRYERNEVTAVLDAGVIAHVGVTTPDGPVVIPMAYAHDGERIYLHGAVANAALRAGAGQDVCVTVTVVDGLIVARAAFHNSMQYRSVMVRGRAERVTDPAEHERVLAMITDHVVDNWDTARPVTAAEIRSTMVLTLPLTEASAKIRAGGPNDDPEDLDGPYWAGSIPIVTTFGEPVNSPDLPPSVEVRPAIAALAGRDVHRT
jgi:nitroimidazol reductase NimA-like FMN-containing flavoprotein (pyridoxamine 5'-phosphate oxidase superfamily)